MVFKLAESAQNCLQTVKAAHLVALLRTAARTEHGQLVERHEPSAA
ncbi:hypothetical protein ABTY98_21270 [Streptomyces sp. NPDC096040]